MEQILRFNIFGPTLGDSERSAIEREFPNIRIRTFPFAFELTRTPTNLTEVYKLLYPVMDKLAAVPYRRGTVDLFVCPFIKSTPVDCLASRAISKQRHWFVLTGQKENQVQSISECGIPLPLNSALLLVSDLFFIMTLKQTLNKLFILNGYQTLCRSLDLAESAISRGPTALLPEAMAERIQTFYLDLMLNSDRYILIDCSERQELAIAVSNCFGGDLLILGRSQIKESVKQFYPILLTRHLFSEETWRAKRAALQNGKIYPWFLIVAMDEGNAEFYQYEILEQATIQLCQI